MESVDIAYSMLTEQRNPIAVEHALKDVKVPDAYLWVNAARYLASLGREEAIPYLIKSLRHTAFRGDDQAVLWLEDLTGEKFGANFGLWQNWWLAENPDSLIDWKSSLGPRPRIEGTYKPHESAAEGDGSVAAFLMESLEAAGAQIDYKGELPELGERWRYFLDSKGATFFIFGEGFERVARFLRDLMGDPDPERGSVAFADALSWQQGFYSIEDKNAGVSYVRNKEGWIQIDVIRPSKDAQE